MLAFTSDNVTSNDTQTAELEKKKNSFNLGNHVRCFNHTVQLSAKALLCPFTICVSSATTDDEVPLLEDVEDDGDGDDGDGNDVEDVEDEDDPLAEDGNNVDNDVDDGVDELAELSEEERDKVLEETAAVKQTITKVSRIVAHLQYLTMSSLGSTTCIRNHPLHHNCIAGMATHLQRQTPQAKSNSLGCLHAMEFDLRYVIVCHQVSRCH